MANSSNLSTAQAFLLIALDETRRAGRALPLRRIASIYHHREGYPSVQVMEKLARMDVDGGHLEGPFSACDP